MLVGYYGARPLGWQVKTIIEHTPGVELLVNHISTGWWGTVGQDSNVNAFEYAPDLVISCQTPHIFTAEEIDVCPIINLHTAPLPNYRGCNGPAHAIINGEREYAVHLHRVDVGIDTGKVLATSTMLINDWDTGRSLYEHAHAKAGALFSDVWPMLIEYAKTGASWGQVQEGGTYYKRNSLEAYRDLASWPEEQHDRITRAMTFYPFEGAK